MSQIQGTGSAQSSMAWLFAIQQGGAVPSSAAAQGAGNSGQAAFDPFSALLPAGPQGADASATQPFSLGAMRTLLSAQEQANGLSADQQKVFSELDTDGDGKVTQSELETDFGTDNKVLADAVMKKLDINGDGAVDESEFAAGTKKSLHRHRGAHGPQGLEALMQTTQAARTQTTSNGDGSTTTTLSYADGSTVSMTTPAAATNADSAAGQGSAQSLTQANLLEQLIKLQAQLTASFLPATMTATV